MASLAVDGGYLLTSEDQRDPLSGRTMGEELLPEPLCAFSER